LGLAYLGFVSLGLPDGLNGVAWPAIRAHFNLPVDSLGSLLVMFTAGYLVSSFASGQLLASMSVGALLASSSATTSLSLIGYAVAPSWLTMVALSSVAGLGAGAIDAGLNTFAATEFSPRIVSWLHACYGIGAASGPLIMTSVLAAHHRWQLGYAIVGVGQLLLAACFARSSRLRRSSANPAPVEVTRTPSLATLRTPIVWLGGAIFFMYTGIEAAAGAWAYSLFTEARGVSTVTAGTWVSIYWCNLTVGRLLSGFIGGRIPAQRLLGSSMIGIATGASLLWVGGAGLLSYAGLGFMGLACAPVFPAMISSTPARLGRSHTANAIGFQIAAAVLGQSLLPALIGVIAQRLGLEVIGPALLVSGLVLVVLYFSLAMGVRDTKCCALRHRASNAA
jgi:fucose permease